MGVLTLHSGEMAAAVGKIFDACWRNDGKIRGKIFKPADHPIFVFLVANQYNQRSLRYENHVHWVVCFRLV